MTGSGRVGKSRTGGEFGGYCNCHRNPRNPFAFGVAGSFFGPEGTIIGGAVGAVADFATKGSDKAGKYVAETVDGR